MSHDMAVTGHHVPHGLRDVLSDFFRVPPERVFVRCREEQDQWSAEEWDALGSSVVSCPYERLRGDLAWSLPIYHLDEDRAPSVTDLALRIAREFDTLALFPVAGDPPYLWHLATPRGDLCHAALDEQPCGEPESDAPARRIGQVDRPVRELPGAAVLPFLDPGCGAGVPASDT
ncbi:hypothetical protein [Streptomyces hainanensis]|uniref:Uncharacterized protein n=1 Tax=Streptomyces hainanensis TaxID=402648 RepID=A0A4R4TJ69_9ACTN|nr:hypothetical protein [Streptomyces hainanensis]TDC77710.1 hypothetical protein E1283_06700 [Streptomyces hainanensis]